MAPAWLSLTKHCSLVERWDSPDTLTPTAPDIDEIPHPTPDPYLSFALGQFDTN